MKKSSEKLAPKEHLRVLVDSGATGSIILKKHAKRHGLNSKKTTSWKTAAGIVTTHGEVSVNCMFPELSESKIITHEFHVMKGSPDFPYDMVLGQDVITELGINLDFKSQQIKWGKLGVDMKEPNFISKDQRSFTFYESTEPKAVREDTKHATRILDANYEKANIPNLVEECSHLNKEEQNKLLEVLV
jgi:hypothetical protein